MHMVLCISPVLIQILKKCQNFAITNIFHSWNHLIWGWKCNRFGCKRHFFAPIFPKTIFLPQFAPKLYFSPHRSPCMLLRRIKFGFWINFPLLWNQFRDVAHPAPPWQMAGRSWNWIVFRIREISTQRKFNQLIWADRSATICRVYAKLTIHPYTTHTLQYDRNTIHENRNTPHENTKTTLQNTTPIYSANIAILYYKKPFTNSAQKGSFSNLCLRRYAR